MPLGRRPTPGCFLSPGPWNRSQQTSPGAGAKRANGCAGRQHGRGERREVVQSASDPNSGCQTVAVGGGRVVGHVMVQRKGGAFSHVGVVSVCVAPELRRRGIGSVLLAAAEEWAQKHSVIRLEAVCNVQDLASNGLFQKARYMCEAVAMWAYARNPAGELVTGQQWARYVVTQPKAAEAAQ